MVLMLTVERFFKSDALGETVSKVILFILFKICVKYIVLNMDFEYLTTFSNKKMLFHTHKFYKINMLGHNR